MIERIATPKHEKETIATPCNQSELIEPLAALRWPISGVTIRNLICKLECKVEGHESGNYPLIDVAYSDCKHDLELLKKLMGS